MDSTLGWWFYETTAANPWILSTSQALDLLTGPWLLRGLVIAAVVWVWRRDRSYNGLPILGLLLVGGVTSELLKALFTRPRPVWDEPLASAGGWSMPSGHSLNAALTMTLILILLWPHIRRNRGWLVAGAVIVMLAGGLHRFFLGVHYPTDVLAGWAIGIAIGLIAIVPSIRSGSAHPPG